MNEWIAAPASALEVRPCRTAARAGGDPCCSTGRRGMFAQQRVLVLEVASCEVANA